MQIFYYKLTPEVTDKAPDNVFFLYVVIITQKLPVFYANQFLQACGINQKHSSHPVRLAEVAEEFRQTPSAPHSSKFLATKNDH